MAKLSRVYQKLFGSSAGANQISQFGSLAEGVPTFTTDPETIQGLSRFLDGWYSAVIGKANPTIEDMNALFVLVFRQLAYILEQGVPEWDPDTTYNPGQMVTSGVVNDRSGDIFVCLATNVTNVPTTNSDYWRKLSGQVIPRSANTSFGDDDNGCIFLCDTSGGAFSVTIAPGLSSQKNAHFTIKDVAGTFGSNPVTIVREGSESIEGVAADYVCDKPNRAYTFVCDGTDWWVTSTALDTKPGAGDFVGEGGTQFASANNATGLNVIGNSADKFALITQQKHTTTDESFGALFTGGTSENDYSAIFNTAFGQGIGAFRGDAILEMFAGGIKFPASQVASSDPNVLDDYEEGTFTPSLAYETPGTSSFNYSVRTGVYIKTGKKVWFSAFILLSAFSKGTASGTITITDLPFTSRSGNPPSVLPVFTQTWPFTNAYIAYIGSASTTVAIYGLVSNAPVANVSDPGNTSSIVVSGCYEAIS